MLPIFSHKIKEMSQVTQFFSIRERNADMPIHEIIVPTGIVGKIFPIGKIYLPPAVIPMVRHMDVECPSFRA